MIPFLDLKAINAQYADELKEACAKVIAQYCGTKHCIGCCKWSGCLDVDYRSL